MYLCPFVIIILGFDQRESEKERGKAMWESSNFSHHASCWPPNHGFSKSEQGWVASHELTQTPPVWDLAPFQLFLWYLF